MCIQKSASFVQQFGIDYESDIEILATDIIPKDAAKVDPEAHHTKRGFPAELNEQGV